MTALLLTLFIAAPPALADDSTEDAAEDSRVEIDADINIDGLEIQLDSSKEGDGSLRIRVDGQELVIEGDQARGELKLGDLTIKAEGDQLRVQDEDGEQGVIQLGNEERTED